MTSDEARDLRPDRARAYVVKLFAALKKFAANQKQLDDEFACDFLAAMMGPLDELDGEDFFGTNGWRYFLMGED